MCFYSLLNICSLRIFFKLTCSLLTLLLIYQELFSFLVLKPTRTSTEEKGLTIDDFPDVVICLEPGFQSNVLEKNGYIAHKYYKGEMNKKFFGWNGNGTKSSVEILEDALLVKRRHISESKFITRALYRDLNQQHVTIGINFITLLYPYGRCFHISLYDIQGYIDSISINTLYLIFNETMVNSYKNRSVKIYFMERLNGLKIFPDENDMTGDTLEIRTDRKQSYKSTYKIKIARSQFVEGDPHIKCSTYSDNSYDDCTRKELLGTFHELLGCSPPLWGKDHTKTCNERFNFSMNIETKIKKMFLQMYEHDVRFECKTPCSKDKYTSKLVHQVPSPVPKIMIR